MAQPARKLEPVSNDDKDEEKPKSDKVVVAAGEVVADGDGPKVIKWRDLDLAIPPEIPPVLMFDFVSMEGDDSAMSLMRMFHTLLETAQFTQVRNVIGRLKPEEQVEAITELASTVMEAYGTEEGESEASEDS